MGINNSKIVATLLFMAGVGLSGMSGLSDVPNPFNPPPAQTIQGEILMIQGESYLIRGSAENEISLRVDDNTVRLEPESFRVGDVIIADVAPDGHAITITTILPSDKEDLQPSSFQPSER
jgi:hypothetical protein